MTSVKKTLIALFMISVLVLLSIFYLETRARGQAATVERVGNSTSDSIDSSSFDERSHTASQSTERQSGAQSESDAELEQAITQAREASPFATSVDELGEGQASGGVREEPEGAGVSQKRDSAGVSADRTPSAPVFIPESYPISEASRYYVPKEDRRPGNLGGPPPLEFPGGPDKSAEPGTLEAVLPPQVPQ